MVMIRGRAVPRHCVRKSGEMGEDNVRTGASGSETKEVAKKEEEREKVLEVDVEGAWREMGLEAGWGNELEVEVFV